MLSNKKKKFLSLYREQEKRELFWKLFTYFSLTTFLFFVLLLGYLVFISASLDISSLSPLSYLNVEENKRGEWSGTGKNIFFTELFSGDGWKDRAKSSVYHDMGTTRISFPPAYEWKKRERWSSEVADVEAVETASNGENIVFVSPKGKIHALDKENGLLSAEVGVDISFDNSALEYDSTKDVWILALYKGGKARITSFRIQEDDILRLNTHTSFDISEGLTISDRVDISCLQGECLAAVGVRFYWFPIADPGRFSPLDPQPTMEQAGVAKVGKTEDFWVAGVTAKKEESFNSDLYVIRPRDISASAPAYAGDADCRLREGEWREGRIEVTEEGSVADGCAVIEPGIVSEYPGFPEFVFHPQDNKLWAGYLAYRGNIFEFEADEEGLAADPANLSFYLTQRLAKGHNIDKMFRHGSAMWMSSKLDAGEMVFKEDVDAGFMASPKKIARIEEGMQAELTDSIPGDIEAIELMPGPDPDRLFVVASGDARSGAEGFSIFTDLEVYELLSRGYDTKKEGVEWVSSQLNGNVGGEVAEAEITDHKGEENGGEIRYYFTADGGENWVEAPIGETVDLTERSYAHWRDFRWKAELISGREGEATPWLNRVHLKYKVY